VLDLSNNYVLVKMALFVCKSMAFGGHSGIGSRTSSVVLFATNVEEIKCNTASPTTAFCFRESIGPCLVPAKFCKMLL